MRLIFIFFLSCGLISCGHTPLMTMYKMRNFNLSTTDASLLRAAVRFPENVRVEPGKVILSFQYWRKGNDKKRDVNFVLEEFYSSKDMEELSKYKKKGFIIKAYRVSKKDLPRVEALRKEFGDFKKKNKGQGGGSMSVGAEACRIDTTKNPIILSTYFKSQETKSYVVLANELDIMKHVGQEKLPEVVPLCT